MSNEGDCDDDQNPIGTVVVQYALTQLREGLAGTATYKGEAVALQCLTSEAVGSGARLTWRQSLTRPMRLNLTFDVLVDGNAERTLARGPVATVGGVWDSSVATAISCRTAKLGIGCQQGGQRTEKSRCPQRFAQRPYSLRP